MNGRRGVFALLAVALVLAATAWQLGLLRHETAAGQPAAQTATPVPAASTPAPASPASAQSDRTIDPEAVLMRARQRIDRFPAIDWNVDARAEALGPGVDSAFAYVRDEIGYEPYSGALRGAAGTYTARAGNAIDRALLLARLLGRHGIGTRFAIGTLSEEQRGQLLARTFARTPGKPLSALPETDGKTFHQRLFRRAKQDYEAVRAALGPRLQPATQPTRDQVLLEMNPHVWVQAEVKGQWVDLDPSFAGATVGRAVAVLERTAAELPPELHQRVTIRIVVDRLTNGSLSASTLLDVTRNAMDVTDRQIAVSHSKAAAGSSGLGAAMAGAFGRAVDPQWKPLLWIDGASTFGAPLDVGAALVTEWLEVELSWPDGRREITRRALVDRRGAGWRLTPPFDASGLRPLQRGESGPFALLATHNVWFSSGRHNLSEFAVAMWEMAVRAALDHASELERAADETALLPPPSENPGELLWPFALPNFAWMVWTDHVVIPLLNDRPGIRLYSDGPRIAIFTAGPQGDGRTMALADLRRDDLRGVVATAADASILADKKLWFGMLQGALEHEAMTEYVVLAGGDASKVESTSSAASTGSLVVLTADALAQLPAIADAAASARLRSALESRHVIVSTAEGLQKGFWWETVSGTAETRAVAGLGLHGVSGRDLPPRQIKNAGKGGTYATPEYRKELEAAERAARKAKQEADAIQKYQASLPKGGSPSALTSPKSGSGGGEMGEYAAALAAAVLHAIAYHILSQMLVERIEVEIEHVIDWLKAGGFSQVIG